MLQNFVFGLFGTTFWQKILRIAHIYSYIYIYIVVRDFRVFWPLTRLSPSLTATPLNDVKLCVFTRHFVLWLVAPHPRLTRSTPCSSSRYSCCPSCSPSFLTINRDFRDNILYTHFYSDKSLTFKSSNIVMYSNVS